MLSEGTSYLAWPTDAQTTMLDAIESQLERDAARKAFNNPFTECTRYGICVRCEARFTWTGSIPETPNCGHCGRKHTEEDFKLYQMTIENKDKSEVDMVGSMRNRERQSNKKSKPRKKN